MMLTSQQRLAICAFAYVHLECSTFVFLNVSIQEGVEAD